MTVWGRVVRADSLDALTDAGWAAAVDHGIRTIVDLRNDDEIDDDLCPRPAQLRTHHLPLDASEDREFWDSWGTGPQFGTPLYYGPHLVRFPERSVAALKVIADAEPGGVVFHCAGGRDRTGQITMLVLSLVGVAAWGIAADYSLSNERLPVGFAARGEPDHIGVIEAHLAERGTSAEGLIVSLVAEFGLEERLTAAGLTADDRTALRRRLLDP